ncbi:phosphatase PAP2 family protein [Gluconacetobacter azotocaptans]|uniref:Acid phosphatase n=1 Tax=Gluconacetobacter azotocaptans TaxID=142834 RepID=A0A7W4JPB8_9PROT|nr:phosphatase PAP2 family protein [Gluconacetobacter azotocaptans]MBB2188471.1 phosphatase PAP2 family protein [Gluconacetobacter azotocaptans]GBQ27930.1 acid phosphatase precursor [Gluconacetobacter azotocaptans DSM 13594]
MMLKRLALSMMILAAGPARADPLLPDGRTVLPPPPAPHSAAQAEDQEVFDRTRRLVGSARWAMAREDAELAPARLLADFSCAAGMTLEPARLQPQLEARITEEKQFWKRQRPFVDTDRPICTDDSAHLRDSPAYPSGHTTHGWIVAGILAELMPDRATDILHRGRAFGESRIVCGVHWKSDVQAGWLNGAAMFAALQADPGFQADMAAAGHEIAALRAHPATPDPERCAVEARVAAQPIE